MPRVKRFATLNSSERRLVLRAFFLVCCVRAGLFLLPFRTVQRLTGKVGRQAGMCHPARRCVWAIRAASRFVPRATCLTQALSAQVLLAQAGHNSQIHIGVGKDQGSGFRAHAWVVHENEIVIGGADVDGYVPLVSLERR